MKKFTATLAAIVLTAMVISCADDSPSGPNPSQSSSSVAQAGLSSSSMTPSSSPSGGNGSSSGSGNSANEFYRYYDPYSTVAQRCQDGFVENKCNGEWYSPATHICRGNEIITLSEYYAQLGLDYIRQCGDDWYSGSMYRCQDGVIEINPNYAGNEYEPCGNRLYLTSSQRCQNGIIETSCGDELWYNITTQVCRIENISGTVSRKVIDKGKCGESNFVIANKCGNQEYYADTQGCCNNAAPFDRANQRCQSNVVQTECGTGWILATENCYDGISGSVMHGSQTYRTVGIGSQMWMAENLNYAVEGSKCYDNDPANCDTYGRLYNWAIAMVLDASCNSSDCSGQVEIRHKGICPEGWRIPTDGEWTTLTNYVGNNASAKLRAISGWNRLSTAGNVEGTDDYGFSALPGGYGRLNGNFYSVGS